MVDLEDAQMRERLALSVKLTMLLALALTPVMFISIQVVDFTEFPEAPPSPPLENVTFSNFGFLYFHAYFGLGAIDLTEWACERLIGVIHGIHETVIARDKTVDHVLQLAQMKHNIANTEALMRHILGWTRYWLHNMLFSMAEFMRRLWLFRGREDKIVIDPQVEEMKDAHSAREKQREDASRRQTHMEPAPPDNPNTNEKRTHRAATRPPDAIMDLAEGQANFTKKEL